MPENDESRPAIVNSVPSELVGMLKAQTLESQTEASFALARLSSRWCAQTAIPHEVLDLLGTCLRSADFDVRRCAAICLANTAKIEARRDDLTSNYGAMSAIVETILSSSSVSIVRESLRALDNLCESHADAVWVVPRSKICVSMHMDSPDSQVRHYAASLNASTRGV